MTLFDRDIQFVDHIGKEREINDTPNDKIDPDKVRADKLNKIIEGWYDEIKNHKKALKITDAGISQYSHYIRMMLEDINVTKHTERYNSKEITNALLVWFLSEDIIEFLLTNYMENL